MTRRLAQSLDEAVCSNEFWSWPRRCAARTLPGPGSLTTRQTGSTTHGVRVLTFRQEMIEALGLQKAREMIARRDLLVTGAAGGAALVLPRPEGAMALPDGTAVTPRAGSAGTFPVPTLDPTTVPKYVTDLVIPPVMPKARHSQRHGIDTYVIGVRQFSQQVLPPTLPSTTVWGYGSLEDRNTFNSPSFTIEARVDRPVRVTWVNDLVDSRGRFLPHLLAVDPTLHWANPPGGEAGRDSRPTFTSTPGPYTGPVPIVTHLHGGHSTEESDGYTEAWYLPRAKNIPRGFATVGSFYNEFREEFAHAHGLEWEPGTATFQYANDQRAATLWFHDHTLGMTRLNVYAGPAGFYLLRGGESDLSKGVLPGPAPAFGDPPGTRYHEIPLAIQDRSFNSDGSLFYPASREFFDGFPGPYIPTTDVPPIWNPEFFANTMVVNGRTWPKLEVEPRRYRLRFLNGCNARFLILKIADSPTARPAQSALPFWQIGNEGGFLPAPVRQERLLLANAERADVIVDFTGIPEGTELYLINEGADEPFGRGEPGVDFPVADPATTGQVMKFVVGPPASKDTSVPPDQLRLPRTRPLGSPSVTRRLSLNEVQSSSPQVPPGTPVQTLLGTVDSVGNPVLLGWADPVTENPRLNATETWELYNFTVDAHPIHIHEVAFEVVNRQPFDGSPIPPESWERGFKDTVIAYPGEITRVKARFDHPGRFVWHCHIVEHEDNEMMRPYHIGGRRKKDH
ncbi:multicopper oxidase family protein [Streptomyces cathayae]|uniref:Multicopper oxidase n=1 Tax=Streptomyces cathayae TaxID=3031124 RepID=A0ABY8K2A5_9ACTN|nr:multicopper oxidase [Streptomyces sp. HUAS 5]WGD42392.1 multicopper oxidase [Streptomyces sp. HUAS 5]